MRFRDGFNDFEKMCGCRGELWRAAIALAGPLTRSSVAVWPRPRTHPLARLDPPPLARIALSRPDAARRGPGRPQGSAAPQGRAAAGPAGPRRAADRLDGSRAGQLLARAAQALAGRSGLAREDGHRLPLSGFRKARLHRLRPTFECWYSHLSSCRLSGRGHGVSSARATASGSRSMTINRVLAAGSGMRRCCSQSRIAATDRP